MHRRRILALLTAGVVAVVPYVAASPATAEDPPSAAITSLPYAGTFGGGPGTAMGNAAVAAACNGGAAVRLPEWFDLPSGDMGAVYARALATQGGRVTASIRAGAAFVDAHSGAVLGCASGRPGAQLAPLVPGADRRVQVVAFLPEPYEDGTGDGARDILRIVVDRTSGTAPANDTVAAARPVGALPLTETVDTVLADDDAGGLGGCHWAPRRTAWWTYRATSTGKLHVAVRSEMATVASDTWPGASVGVARVTEAGRVQVLPAPSDTDCVTPVSSGDVSLERGATYLIGGFVAEDPPEPSLVLGGRITLDVAAPTPPAVPSAPTSVSVSALQGPRTATLTWGPPADDGGSPVTGYRVSRDGAAPTSTVLPAGAASFTFRHLRPWTRYHLTVAATNPAGTGPGATVSVLTRAPTPSSPRRVRATAGGHAATVRWVAPAHSGVSAITSYRIRRYAARGRTVQGTTTVPGAASRAVVRHLRNGDGYRFDVTAVNGSGPGQVSARSAVVRPHHRAAVATRE